MQEDVAYFERADASLLARTPATLSARAWAPDQNWEEFRQYLERRLNSLRNWRRSWWLHWGEIAANMLARRYHWLVTANQMARGLPINQEVVDSTPTQAIGVCAAGLMDGLSSPTKEWFRFQPAIQGYEPDAAGKAWIAEFQYRVYAVLAASNYYDAKHQQYEDEVTFGTAPKLIYEHRNAIINCKTPCAGEYYLTTAADYSIGAFYSEFTNTVVQLVEGFGRDAIAGTDAAQLWDAKQLDTEMIVAHAIEPNFPVAEPGQKQNLGVVPGGFAYREVYWLRGKTSQRPLAMRGLHEKNFDAPRWYVRSNEPYGRSPGMDALPDVRQLHQMTRRHAEAVDKGVRPPMLADAALKNEPSSVLPGRVTYVPNLGKDTGMRPSYQVDARFVEFLQKDIERIQQRVERWFFNDVFMMISQMEGVQPRNELELNERRGEKLLRLGPVIERNLREDAIAMTRIVSIMNRRGLIPPKPPSLANVPIEIKFVSKLALIQDAVVTASMERALSMAGRMEPVLPGTLDNFPKDRYIRAYADKLGYPGDLWASEQEMKAVREARAQTQAAATAAHNMKEVTPALAAAGKNMGETDVGGGLSALQLLLGNGGMPMTGTGAPQ